MNCEARVHGGVGTLDELECVEGDPIGLVLFTVFGGKGDFASGDVFDAVVIDGFAVGIAPERVDHLCGTAERPERVAQRADGKAPSRRKSDRPPAPD